MADELANHLGRLEVSNYSDIDDDVRADAACRAFSGLPADVLAHATVRLEQATNRQTEVLYRIYQILLNGLN